MTKKIHKVADIIRENIDKQMTTERLISVLNIDNGFTLLHEEKPSTLNDLIEKQLYLQLENVQTTTQKVKAMNQLISLTNSRHEIKQNGLEDWWRDLFKEEISTGDLPVYQCDSCGNTITAKKQEKHYCKDCNTLMKLQENMKEETKTNTQTSPYGDLMQIWLDRIGETTCK